MSIKNRPNFIFFKNNVVYYCKYMVKIKENIRNGFTSFLLPHEVHIINYTDNILKK